MYNKPKNQSSFAPISKSSTASSPVECLGMKFSNDVERRKYFTEKLKEKLKDPVFRQIEGFPIGNDEDILALSDPPYYTACPNPFIGDLIRVYGRQYDEKSDHYSREPFAADISEGKNEPIYNAHTYHTKVPHKAIMRYILHYTEPGDIVLDGFSGTGMTGVAAQSCAKPDTDFKAVVEKEMPEVKWGERRAILGDLCPAAAFIAYNYNTPANAADFEGEARRILAEVEKECGWMHETIHTDGSKGRINYTVWSDVFICSSCSKEIVFWEAATDDAGGVAKSFPCPHCNAVCSKHNMQRAFETKFDKTLNQSTKQVKQVPVLIRYSIGNKRFEKKPDKYDISLVRRIEDSDIPYWYPTDRMPEGDESRRNDRTGITHVHHFYTKRNLWMLAATYDAIIKTNEPLKHNLLLLFTSQLINISKLNRYRPQVSFPYNPLSGTLYISSQVSEANIIIAYDNKIDKMCSAFQGLAGQNYVYTESSTQIYSLNNGTIDYVFIDPPFGANLMYSELNFLWEAWLKILTNNKEEAIINDVQRKGLPEYQTLMERCFAEFYRSLKPSRWMTVEFHNSANSVWNSIQEALQQVGFVVADVRTLDKQQGTFKQVTSAGAVKQDLIISAYKPSDTLERKFKLEAGTEAGAWDFIREHLRQLPVFVGKNSQAQVVAERQSFMLYDRMVAFHVQHGVLVPLSAAEFYAGLAQKFPERDGMFFLPEQAPQYEKKRMTVKEFQQLALIVKDESTAIQWLRQSLYEKPQTFQELHPHFMREIGGWQKFEKPLELKEMLEENFICYDGMGEVPSQAHSYLSTNFHELRGLTKDNPLLQAKAKDRWYVPDPNKSIDLEKLRDRSLLKEFQEYVQFPQKRLKVFRLEAVRAGFKRAWADSDYKTIVDVAEKLPDIALEEDQMLLMWYSNAQTRLGAKLI